MTNDNKLSKIRIFCLGFMLGILVTVVLMIIIDLQTP